MKVFVIQSGTYADDGTLKYSITSQRQIDSLTKAGINVKVGLVTSRTSPSGVRENIKRLKEEVQQFQPDVIHSHYGSMVGYVASEVAKNKYPLVASFCGDDLLGTPNKGISWRIREILATGLSKIVARRASQIITKSLNLYNALSSKSQSKATIVPNGIDETFFKPHSNKPEIRTQLGWEKEVFMIFFNSSTGTNRTVKNPTLAYVTLKELKKLGINAKMEDVSKLPAPEFQKRMAASDCLIVTSLHEGSPNIVKEAMACNLPIVTVNCGDVEERLKNVNTGGIYNYDALELAKAIQEVTQFGGIYNGREEFLRQGLDETSIAKRITEIYKKAI